MVSHKPTSCPGKNTLIAQEARTNAQVHIAGHTHTHLYTHKHTAAKMCNSYLIRSCWQINALMINRWTSHLCYPGGRRPQGPDFLCRPLIENTAQVKQINMLPAGHAHKRLPFVCSPTNCFSDLAIPRAW